MDTLKPTSHDPVSTFDRRSMLRVAGAGAAGAGLATLGLRNAAASPVLGAPRGKTRSQAENPFGTPTTTGGTYVAVSQGVGYPHIFIPISYYGTTAFFVCKLLYSPLVLLDSEWNEMTPGLATSWEWSEDQTQLTMHLREGVTFHDGQPFTARDVEFTYKLMVRKESFPSVQDVTIFQGGKEYRDRATEEFAGVTVIDDLTVRFNLLTPASNFLLNVSDTGILPAHLFAVDDLTSEGDTEAVAFFSDKPVGTGPFKLVSFDLSSNVTLEANPDYFKGAPILDGIVLRFDVAAPAQIAGLESGEIDGAFTVSFQDAQVLSENDQLTFLPTTAMGNVRLITVSTEKAYLPVAVRQALLHAIDIQTLISSVTYGFAEPCPSMILWAPLFPNDALPSYPYDPERAKQLLQEAGWDSSTKLKFARFTQQGTPENAFAAIMNMWKAVGVDSEYVPLDPAQQVELSQAADHAFDLVYDGLAWQAYDPTANYGFLGCGQPGNYSHYCNAEWDALMAEAIRTVDPAKAIELLQQIQVIAQTDLPYIPLWIEPDFWIVNKRMHGGILGRGPINDIQAELWWKE
jgi:peptide/nickel transport system substrate-binding protein